VQRNAALKMAKGELIYFLDDDSRPEPGNLRKAVVHFRKPEVKMLGGPNLCPADAPALEQIFAVALSSWLAFGPSRARYDSVGKLRPSSEKELILCNLMARREDLQQLGGFDESLYPNEENALMDELQKRGAQLLYDPEFIVYRRPRPTLRAFCKMLLNYGRGRAEQFRLHPTFGSALNFVPPVFCLYIVIFPVLMLALVSPLLGVPFACYALAIMLQTMVSAFKKPFLNSVAAAPLLMVTHILYGLGFWRGLFTKLTSSAKQSVSQVALERICA